MRWNAGYSVIGLVILILEIVAIVEIFKSGRPLIEKLLWTLLIIVAPLLGLLIYFFLGRSRSAKM